MANLISIIGTGSDSLDAINKLYDKIPFNTDDTGKYVSMRMRRGYIHGRHYAACRFAPVSTYNPNEPSYEI